MIGFRNVTDYRGFQSPRGEGKIGTLDLCQFKLYNQTQTPSIVWKAIYLFLLKCLSITPLGAAARVFGISNKETP
jgi:hypothetical protein